MSDPRATLGALLPLRLMLRLWFEMGTEGLALDRVAGVAKTAPDAMLAGGSDLLLPGAVAADHVGAAKPFSRKAASKSLPWARGRGGPVISGVGWLFWRDSKTGVGVAGVDPAERALAGGAGKSIGTPGLSLRFAETCDCSGTRRASWGISAAVGMDVPTRLEPVMIGGGRLEVPLCAPLSDTFELAKNECP